MSFARSATDFTVPHQRDDKNPGEEVRSYFVPPVDDGRFARRVRAARFACRNLAAGEPLRAAPFACLASAPCEAADLLSFLSARNVARERFDEATDFADRPRLMSRLACLRVRALA